MSLADEPESTVPPASDDPLAPPAESANTAMPEEPATAKKGRKKKEKKKKRDKVAAAENAVETGTDAETLEGEETSRRRFKLADLSIYVVMLMIAFGFLLLGSILLWIEFSRYGFDTGASG